MWYVAFDETTKQPFEALLPLTKVQIKGKLIGSVTKLEVELYYKNDVSDTPIECEFEFPLKVNSAVTKLSAEIGDKVVESCICEKS